VIGNWNQPGGKSGDPDRWRRAYALNLTFEVGLREELAESLVVSHAIGPILFLQKISQPVNLPD